MIDLLRTRLAKIISREHKVNFVREFLQILTLKVLADHQHFRSIAFLGGTALRILYDQRRYSEDLDFSIINHSLYNFEDILNSISREMELRNISHELKIRKGVVDTCMINFTTVLQDLGVSVARDQKLSIKLEIDTNPPQGAVTVERIVNKEFLFPLRHHDRSSLMAGKLHAILYRSYAKGRDYYDLLWYLTQKIEPNVELLINSIEQTEKKPVDRMDFNWRNSLLTRLDSIDMKIVRRDVEAFLEDKIEVDLLTLKNLKDLLIS